LLRLGDSAITVRALTGQLDSGICQRGCRCSLVKQNLKRRSLRGKMQVAQTTFELGAVRPQLAGRQIVPALRGIWPESRLPGKWPPSGIDRVERRRVERSRPAPGSWHAKSVALSDLQSDAQPRACIAAWRFNPRLLILDRVGNPRMTGVDLRPSAAENDGFRPSEALPPKREIS
jgi:hypothetical protein